YGKDRPVTNPQGSGFSLATGGQDSEYQQLAEEIQSVVPVIDIQANEASNFYDATFPNPTASSDTLPVRREPSVPYQRISRSPAEEQIQLLEHIDSELSRITQDFDIKIQIADGVLFSLTFGHIALGQLPLLSFPAFGGLSGAL